jgi:hypothetical protein
MPPAPIVDPGAGLGGIDRTPDPACTATWLAGTSGRVEDATGAGIPGARTQLCIVLSPSGTLLCLVPPTTNDGGDFEVGVAAPESRCVSRATMRILQPGSRYATTYCEPPLAPVDSVIDFADPIVLFPVEPTPCLAQRGDATMPRTVTLARGLELVSLRPDRISRYDQLAVGRHDLPPRCMGERAPAGLLATWGFAPETDFPLTTSVGVRIPNETALAAGTSVELWVLGGLDSRLPDDTRIEEGTWATFGRGTVSADGATIESDPGVRLPALTWLGYRLPAP